MHQPKIGVSSLIRRHGGKLPLPIGTEEGSDSGKQTCEIQSLGSYIRVE